LAQALSTQVLALFGDRVLSMDVRATACFAKARAGAQSQGNTVDLIDPWAFE
jgi:hypothetical protein